MEKNCVVLYKAGKFYSAYGDCGIIIHNLMGYKYVEYKHSAGFPESSIVKVKKALEDAKLPYMIYEKETLIEESKGLKKNYNIILKESLKKMEMETRLNRLQTKLDNFSLNDLEKVVEGIEDNTINE